MHSPDTIPSFTMKDGRQFEIMPCIQPGTPHTARFLRQQIIEGIRSMSNSSRWHRFAMPVRELSSRLLDHLTDLDGKNRVALCAVIHDNEQESGIGLARYFRQEDEDRDGIAEFAITVIDDFQGQGVGLQLLRELLTLAASNHLRALRGYILPGNIRMLSLCNRLGARYLPDDSGFIVAELATDKA